LVVEDLKRGTNPAEKGGRPKDIFEMGSSYWLDDKVICRSVYYLGTSKILKTCL
jgi:hypothetical protein